MKALSFPLMALAASASAVLTPGLEARLYNVPYNYTFRGDRKFHDNLHGKFPLAGQMAPVENVDFDFSRVKETDLVVKEMSAYFVAPESGEYQFSLDASHGAAFQIGAGDTCHSDAYNSVSTDHVIRTSGKEVLTVHLQKSSVYPMRVAQYVTRTVHETPAYVSLSFMAPSGKYVNDISLHVRQAVPGLSPFSSTHFNKKLLRSCGTIDLLNQGFQKRLFASPDKKKYDLVRDAKLTSFENEGVVSALEDRATIYGTAVNSRKFAIELFGFVRVKKTGTYRFEFNVQAGAAFHIGEDQVSPVLQIEDDKKKERRFYDKGLVADTPYPVRISVVNKRVDSSLELKLLHDGEVISQSEFWFHEAKVGSVSSSLNGFVDTENASTNGDQPKLSVYYPTDLSESYVPNSSTESEYWSFFDKSNGDSSFYSIDEPEPSLLVVDAVVHDSGLPELPRGSFLKTPQRAKKNRPQRSVPQNPDSILPLDEGASSEKGVEEIIVVPETIEVIGDGVNEGVNEVVNEGVNKGINDGINKGINGGDNDDHVTKSPLAEVASGTSEKIQNISEIQKTEGTEDETQENEIHNTDEIQDTKNPSESDLDADIGSEALENPPANLVQPDQPIETPTNSPQDAPRIHTVIPSNVEAASVPDVSPNSSTPLVNVPGFESDYPTKTENTSLAAAAAATASSTTVRASKGSTGLPREKVAAPANTSQKFASSSSSKSVNMSYGIASNLTHPASLGKVNVADDILEPEVGATIAVGAPGSDKVSGLNSLSVHAEISVGAGTGLSNGLQDAGCMHLSTGREISCTIPDGERNETEKKLCMSAVCDKKEECSEETQDSIISLYASVDGAVDCSVSRVCKFINETATVSASACGISESGDSSTTTLTQTLTTTVGFKKNEANLDNHTRTETHTHTLAPPECYGTCVPESQATSTSADIATAVESFISLSTSFVSLAEMSDAGSVPEVPAKVYEADAQQRYVSTLAVLFAALLVI